MIAKSKGWYLSVLSAAAAASTVVATSTSQHLQQQHQPILSKPLHPAFIPPKSLSSHQNNLQGQRTQLPVFVSREINDRNGPSAGRCHSSIIRSHANDDDDNNKDIESKGTQKTQQPEHTVRMSPTTSTATTNADPKNEDDQTNVVFYPFNDTIDSLDALVQNRFVTNNTAMEPIDIVTGSSTQDVGAFDHGLENSCNNDDHADNKIVNSPVTANVIEKKVRVAKAQAEIDRILSQPDGAPFDMENELKKVISISAPFIHRASTFTPNNIAEWNVSSSKNNTKQQQSFAIINDSVNTLSKLSVATLSPTTSGASGTLSNMAMVERVKQELMDRHDEISSYDIENQLYDAIRQQDYATAHEKQQLLQQINFDATMQVLQCNAAFYKAFSKKDYRQMEVLWLPNDNNVMCIHPSHVPIVSSHNINQSWKQMFTSTNANFQKTWIEPTNIRISVKGSGNIAIVTCDEQVYVRRFVRGQKRQTELINTLMATNIYRKINQQWYIIHHHASWHPSSDAAKSALSRSSSSSSSASSSYIASLRKRQEAIDNSKNNNSQSNLGLDGIMGMKDIGPLLGDLKPKKSLSQQQQSPPPQRRIVMGSLSDILNGNLEDLLNGGTKSSDNSKKDSDDSDGAAIIQFHRIASDDDDDDEDDLDDMDDLDIDDDDDDEIEIDVTNDTSNDDSGTATKDALTMIQEWATTKGPIKRNSKTDSKSNHEDRTKVDQAVTKNSNEYMRTQCLALIRELCIDGMISNNHKRMLLSDMISCESTATVSNVAKKSQVQIAYEFLFTSFGSLPNNNNSTSASDKTDLHDIIKEEFADQCRMIADSISLSKSSSVSAK